MTRIVMKFGGTSVGDAERIRHVAELVAREAEPVVVVVSAMGGTTDQLLEAAAAAERGDWAAAQRIIEALRARHQPAAIDPGSQVSTDTLLAELASVLHGVYLLRETTPRSRALIVSFGERLSAPIVAATLRAAGRSAQAIDSRSLIRTDDRYHDATVDLDTSRTLVREAVLPRLERGEVPVITGFLGSTEDGITTTLGRGGSDYTAGLLGSLLDAREVWIWTDVDGILTADPRLVSEARRLDGVSYREAAEMSYFGAKVLHPRTMLPVVGAGIPLRIRSTFTPDSPGTLVAADTTPSPLGVKTVTSIRDMALITVDGRGMAGIPGVARRIFEATQAASVNVVMISQASSEQTVSLVVRGDEASALVAALRDALSLELAAGLIETIDMRRGVAVVSIIGQGMAGTPGVSGKLFGALGATGVNVLAIAQGGGELSISVAITEDRVEHAVRAVHTAFGLTRVMHLALVGCGRVGRSLLEILAQTRARHLAQHELDLRVVAIATGSRLVLDHTGIDPSSIDDALAAAGPRPDDAELVRRLVAERFTDLVLVDVSAAPLVALHRAALAASIHVVTANKVPLAGPMAAYDSLVAAKQSTGMRYGYETTFAAGLPVLHTLKELLATGDELHGVTGCFSGTLGFLCTRLEDGAGLEEAVAEAVARGYTEPDPREDLSGRDVARKALIIARAMGWRIEPDEGDLTPVVPGLEDGLDVALARYAPELAAHTAASKARGEVLRYVATLEGGRVAVSLQAVPRDSPVGSLRGPDNILVFQTRRYSDYPLVIRGPGAGADVTAAGVLGDILRVAQR